MSDMSAIRAAEKALAEAVESPVLTAWVDFYTDAFSLSGAESPTGRWRIAREMLTEDV
jgi:hypothetical protein